MASKIEVTWKKLHPQPTQVKAKPSSTSVASAPRPVRHVVQTPTGSLINATLELESAIQQYQRAEAKLGGAVTTISKKVDTINQHIDKVLENAPTKLKVSVNVNDADWQKIQELFAKERQWMTAQMQMHIREVNSMFADERKKVRERYKEYDGCYLGHYAQWFFWFFFTIGIFVVAGGVGMMIAQNYR